MLLLLCTTPAAHAQNTITAHLWITNTPAGLSSNAVINIGTADTRRPTNDVTGITATHWQVTNTIAWARSNLYAHLANNPVYTPGSSPQPTVASLNATNASILNITAPPSTNITVTLGAGWGFVTYSTQTLAAAVPILSRTNAMSQVARTNSFNSIVDLLGSATDSINVIPPAMKWLRNYVDAISTQSISNKTLIAPVIEGGRLVNATNVSGTNVALTNVVLRFVSITGADLSGFITALTNGALYSNWLVQARLTNPTTTNLINFGNAIRSEGSGDNSFQAGSNAVATALNAIALGNNSKASNSSSMAVGTLALATNSNASAVGVSSVAGGNGATALGYTAEAIGTSAVAIGPSSSASGSQSTAVGRGATTDGVNSAAFGADAEALTTRDLALGVTASATGGDSTAIGTAASAEHTNSVAIGAGAATTATNQVRLGTSAETVSIPGNLEVAGNTQLAVSTNNTFRGTNILNGRLDLVARNNAGLANGYNSGTILGTNAYLRLSGHSAAATNAGFAAPGGPAVYWVQVDNPGLSYTLLNESGLEATAANRILTGTGALVNSTNNPVMFSVLYDDAAARYRLLSFR